MAKEDIFSKMNIKDYNNQLEKVIEKKDFSESVKNLLLSMLYRIETGYADYEKVKQNVEPKKRFVERIIKIVEEDCKQIQLVKSMSEESKILEGAEFLVEPEQGKIIVYQNERMLLEALLALRQKPVEIEEAYALIQPALQKFLLVGKRMNFVEVLRDFNGWSWDILTKEMDSLFYNVVYQNMVILLGNYFMQKWGKKEPIWQEAEEIEETIEQNPINTILSNKEFDHIYEEEPQINVIHILKQALRENYGEKLALEWESAFYRMICILMIQQDAQEKQNMIEARNKAVTKLEEMKDKKIYVENQSNRKKELALQIKQIDQLLNDDYLLKEEYRTRNSKLANKDKIFSISHLADKLEKERNVLLAQIQEINQSIEPKNFVKYKEDIQKQVDFFEKLGLVEENKHKNQQEAFIDLQKIFLECFNCKINKVETKKQMVSLLYVFRYYLWLPVQEGAIKDIEAIQEEWQQVQNKMIQKACQMKVLTTISQQENFNTKVVSTFLDTKIITLETILLVLKYQKEILKIEIYDDTIHEKTQEIPVIEKTELSVKLNKKIKLFL
ncbi:MAG: hypothetical protein ACLU84_06090 [Clostridia bacterium]